jgi:hypothetical protein
MRIAGWHLIALLGSTLELLSYVLGVGAAYVVVWSAVQTPGWLVAIIYAVALAWIPAGICLLIGATGRDMHDRAAARRADLLRAAGDSTDRSVPYSATSA